MLSGCRTRSPYYKTYCVQPMNIDSRIPPNSRAILIGVPNYRDNRAYPSYPAVGNSLDGMFAVLTDPALCGWPKEAVERIVNPTDSGQLLGRLRALAAQTAGVLLFYFVGHGVLNEDGELCLAISDTDAANPDATGLEYSKIKKMLYAATPANTRIAILDSCYSGRVIGLSATNAQLADLSEVAGTYTLTAADDIAHVAPLKQQDNAYTSFTGELLGLIRSGIPAGSSQLTLGALYPHLKRRLVSKALPCPNQRGTDNVTQFLFTRNATSSRDQGADSNAKEYGSRAQDQWDHRERNGSNGAPREPKDKHRIERAEQAKLGTLSRVPPLRSSLAAGSAAVVLLSILYALFFTDSTSETPTTATPIVQQPIQDLDQSKRKQDLTNIDKQSKEQLDIARRRHDAAIDVINSTH